MSNIVNTLKMTLEQLEQSYLLDIKMGNEEVWEKEINQALFAKDTLNKADAFNGVFSAPKLIMQALKCQK